MFERGALNTNSIRLAIFVCRKFYRGYRLCSNCLANGFYVHTFGVTFMSVVRCGIRFSRVIFSLVSAVFIMIARSDDYYQNLAE